MGIFCNSPAVRFSAFDPDNTISINWPSIGTCITLAPSLNTSTAVDNSRTVTPARARAVKSGVMRIWAAPVSREGRARIWLPSRRENRASSAAFACIATGRTSSRVGPTISTRMDRDPPTDRPKSDACWTNARAPGSANTGRASTICNSLTRDGSFAAAPAKAPPE